MKSNKEVQKAIETASKQDWISVEDRLPEFKWDASEILAIDRNKEIWIAHFDVLGEFVESGTFNELKVTHWLPLPSSPEK